MLGNVLSEDTAINFLYVLFFIQFFHCEYKSLWWVTAHVGPSAQQEAGFMFLPLSRASSVAKEVTLPGLQRLQSPLSVSFVSRLFALKAADML